MKKTCMLIPGNPAVADYYYSWAKEIEEENPDMNVVYATSYVLYRKRLNYIEYDLAMRKHYEDIFLRLSSSGKVTILAHSVGGYFALRLLEKYPERIEKVAIIFPYIGYSTIKSLKLLPLLYWIDRFLPLAEIVSKFKLFFSVYGKDVHNISNYELTTNLRFGVRQCMYFERYKFDTGNVASSADKLNFIYTDRDRWCPSEAVDLLKTVSNYKKVNLPHDFILNKEYRIGMIRELGPLNLSVI